MLVLYGVTIIFELLIYLPLLWKTRKAISVLLLTVLPALTAIIFLQYYGLAAIIFLVVSLFRMMNLYRIVFHRSHEQHLYNRTKRTTFILALVLFVVLYLLFNGQRIAFSLSLLHFMALVQFTAVLLFLLVTVRNIIKSRYDVPLNHYADSELPSLTVAVPARNETEDLEDCIRSLLASDYPKLEVIVLDDCSHDKTADTIKKFAHDGVRFVQGDMPKDRWLTKNQAYDKLSSEASGEYILFCGVDTRFGTNAIRQLVSNMLNKNKAMVSVLPRRLNATPSAALIQPMRYWWELALPRRTFNRPPVLSTCWIIHRKFMSDNGGFAAVSSNILPEGYFAREAVKYDAYSFLRAHDELDIQTIKSLDAQKETAVRMRYPQLKKRPESVLLVSSVLIFVMLGPFINLFAGLAAGVNIGLSLAACLLLVITHVLIVWVSNPVNIPIAAINFPFVVLTEVFLIYESMLKYEFSVVEWKGRNICIPVMHTISRLPTIDK